MRSYGARFDSIPAPPEFMPEMHGNIAAIAAFH
jgi:hypothetical protein